MRPDLRSGRLWAITSYFNPMGWRRRPENYRIFRERLGIPLLAVELVYGPGPELGEGDAEILVQLRGRDVLWQKERLLNLAVRHLPPGCDKVVWLDCDVVFADPDWPAAMEAKLDDCALVQGFSHALHLSPDWRPEMPMADGVASRRPSLCRPIADGLPPGAYFDVVAAGQTPDLASGLAWAARRDLVERVGLYDAAIIGSGDRLMAAAAFDRIEGPIRKYGLRDDRLRHYLDWARAWKAAVGGSIGVLDGGLFALWHGEAVDRRYSERLIRLSEFDFDPFADIAADEQGVWRWSSDKPAMQAYVRDYFALRREDGA